MPKVRKPAATAAPTTDQIEAFAAGAEAAPTTQTLDPSAPRNFKALKLGLNEYEYQMLEAASRKTGRSKLNFIRHAVLTMAEKVASD